MKSLNCYCSDSSRRNHAVEFSGPQQAKQLQERMCGVCDIDPKEMLRLFGFNAQRDPGFSILKA
jgi:hypothetical protein